MNTLSQTITQPTWDNKLLQDLAYIKAKSKYPFFRKRILPLALGGLFITAFCCFLFATMNPQHRTWYLFSFFVLPYIGSIANYARSLRFTTINTDYTAHENQQLIVAFLHSLEIAVYQHPDAPEVFQMTSKTVAMGREIILFIADDNRILINGHFTNWLPSIMTHKKEMLDLFNEWLTKNAIVSTDTAIIANSTF